MRKLLLLAVLVSSVFAASASARGNSGYSNNYDSGYDQGYDDAQDDATDWEDHNLPDPQYDTPNTASAFCGPHTLYMDGNANIIIVDGQIWHLVGGDAKTTADGDTMYMSHYIQSVKSSGSVASIGVTERDKKFMLTLPHSPVYSCHKS